MKTPYIARELVFVPNAFCNFGCKYCYLGQLTNTKENTQDMDESFKKIAARLKEQGVLISKVILHGAELTSAPLEDVQKLLQSIWDYKAENYTWIKSFAPKNLENFIHLKTNLYNLDLFFETFVKYKVFISGSVDLPLRIHEKYRTLKNGKSTLPKTLQMLRLLASYPYGKSFSATMAEEALNAEEFIEDVLRIEKLGFDMANDFYIMFAYQSQNARDSFSMASDTKMRDFYLTLRERLADTKFAPAVEHLWFKEFLGGYCTQCTNCGREQLLIQKNGDCYLCHRSQALESLKCGNLFKESFKEIVLRNINNVQRLENQLTLHQDCLECEYFHLCNASCVIERKDTGLRKSYTCALQKEIYQNNPLRFPKNTFLANQARDMFLRENQLTRFYEYRLPNLDREFFNPKNNLAHLIANDPILKASQDKENFALLVNGEKIETRFPQEDLQTMLFLSPKDCVKVLIKKSVFAINCKEPFSQDARIFLLRATERVYGDDKRNKCDHIAHLGLFPTKLETDGEDLGEYWSFEISDFLRENAKNYQKDIPNCLLFLTKEMRAYHYDKQRKNVFYHLQAFNLPFARIEFLWQEETQ